MLTKGKSKYVKNKIKTKTYVSKMSTHLKQYTIAQYMLVHNYKCVMFVIIQSMFFNRLIYQIQGLRLKS